MHVYKTSIWVPIPYRYTLLVPKNNHKSWAWNNNNYMKQQVIVKVLFNEKYMAHIMLFACLLWQANFMNKPKYHHHRPKTCMRHMEWEKEKQTFMFLPHKILLEVVNRLLHIKRKMSNSEISNTPLNFRVRMMARCSVHSTPQFLLVKSPTKSSIFLFSVNKICCIIQLRLWIWNVYHNWIKQLILVILKHKIGDLVGDF